MGGVPRARERSKTNPLASGRDDPTECDIGSRHNYFVIFTIALFTSWIPNATRVT